MVLAKFEIGTRLATVILWIEVRVKKRIFIAFPLEDWKYNTDTTQSILILSWWQRSSWAGYAVDRLVPRWRFPNISSAENLLKESVKSRGTPSQVYFQRPDYKEAIGSALRLLHYCLLPTKKKSLDNFMYMPNC